MVANISEAMDRFKTNEQKLEIFVNGSDTDSYPSPNGDVPSILNFLKAQSEAGLFIPFETEAQLKAYIPTSVSAVGKALDTKKLWLWKDNAWVDMGLSELDQAKNYAQMVGFSGLEDKTRQNFWAVKVFGKPQTTYVPSSIYNNLYANAVLFEDYLPDGELFLNYPNSIIACRAIVTNTVEKVIAFDSLKIDDSLIIFVDGNQVYSGGTTTTVNNVSFTVPSGKHIIDIFINNGASSGGFSGTPNLSTQVGSMYAASIAYKHASNGIADTAKSLDNALLQITKNSSFKKILTQEAFSLPGQVNYSNPTTAGTIEGFANQYTTEFIPVSKGDVITAYIPTLHVFHYTPITFFDTTKKYVQALAHGKPSQMAIPGRKSMLEKVRQNVHGVKENNAFFISGIAPADGYVRVTAPKGLWLNPVSTSPTYGELAVLISTQEKFAEFSNLYVAPKNGFKALVGQWFSPNITTYFKSIVQSQLTVGNPVIMVDSFANSICKIPVKAGQYFHLLASRPNSGNIIHVFDATDKYVKSIELELNEVTQYQTSLNPIFNLNILVENDGFFYFTPSSEVAGLLAIAFTDKKVTYQREYLKETDTIEWTDGAIFGANVGNGFSGGWYTLATSRPLALGASLRPNYGNNVSKPVLLKKGTVLEFTSKIGMPVHLNVLELDKTATTTQMLNVFNFDAVTESVLLSFLNKTMDTTKWWDAVKTTSYYCNEEKDVLVYFNQDSRESIAISNQEASFRLLTKAQYIELRKKLVAGNITAYANMTASNVSTTTPSIGLKPILVFKDEVVTYPCPTMYVDIASTNFDGPDATSPTYVGAAAVPVLTPVKYDDPSQIQNGVDGYLRQSTIVTKTGYLTWARLQYTLGADGKYTPASKNGVDDLLKAFPIVVSPKNEYKPSENTMIYLPNRYVYSNAEGNLQYVVSNNDVNMLIAPVVKGKKYRLTRCISSYMASAQSWFYGLTTKVKQALYFKDVEGNDRVLVHGQGLTMYLQPEEDGYVFLPSVFNDTIYPSDALSIVEVSDDEWNLKAVPTKDTITYIPQTPALRINLVNTVLPYDSTKETTVRGLAQFKLGDQVLKTVNCDFTVQGTGSATLSKKNWDMDYVSPDGESSVEVKIGDWLAQNNLVLKGQGVDATHFRNEANYDLWVGMRKHGPYPMNMIIGKEALDNGSLGLWFTDALGYPRGQTIELYCGDVFYGLYTLRMKKKREQYAMTKANKNHILLQADPTMNTEVPFSWSNISLANWGLRNPSIKTYSEGDDSVNDSVVQASLDRYFNWIKALFAGTTTLKATYQQYINLNSFLDYILHVELTDQWDGLTNNMMMMTWDANIWHAFIYDLDHATDRGYTVCHTMITNTPTLFFKFFFSELLNEMKARWKELRDANVVSMDKVFEYHGKYANQVAKSTRDKDALRWGYGRENNMPRIFTMFSKKMDYMDAYLGYTPKEADYFGNWNPDNLVAGETRTYTFNAPTYKVGDTVQFTFTRDFEQASTTIEAEVLTDGIVTITHSNPTAVSVNMATGVLKIFKK